MEELVLGIETSCDETSVALVAAGREIRANIIASQIKLHRKYGGVVPELASRQHLSAILPALAEAMATAGVGWQDLTAVAVTYGPGLVGSLLVGLTAAKAVAYARRLPLVGVHHIEGHLYANFLAHPELTPPFLCLTVSGGHTELIVFQEHGVYQRLGSTRDDAAGEAFDKVARVLGLGYPGGPALEALAREGDPEAVAFPRALSEEETWDFSFSGLKTAVINYCHRAAQRGEEIKKADLAASFQAAVVDALASKAVAAAQTLGLKTLALSGGVAANGALRAELSRRAEARGLKVLFPPPVLCTDNAAMVACAGTYAARAGRRAELSLNAVPALPLCP